jgi:hypothetical protein
MTVDFLNRGGAKIIAVSLRGEQMDGQPAFFDDLRVGSSSSEVAPPGGIPATSERGLLILTLLTITGGTVVMRQSA